MISCNVTYYNEPTWLKWWYKTVKNINEQGYDIMLNVCDDGSQRLPASEFFNKHAPTDKMRLFRVKEDIGFNSHGARNLLMKQTLTKWNLMSDIDRRYPEETLKQFAEFADVKLQRGNYYSLLEMIRTSPDGYSVNDYIVHSDDFWRTGGYDEEFVNIHWGDRWFLDTLRRVARRVLLPDWKVKYVRGAREVTWADVPTTQYPDDQTLIHPNNRWPDEDFRFGLKDRIKERNKTEEGRMSKQVINFEWEQVF
jgi:hypothetical protein